MASDEGGVVALDHVGDVVGQANGNSYRGSPHKGRLGLPSADFSVGAPRGGRGSSAGREGARRRPRGRAQALVIVSQPAGHTEIYNYNSWIAGTLFRRIWWLTMQTS